MKRLAIALVTAATALSSVAVPQAKAENGQIAAGVAGGLLGGMLLGGALSQPRRHYVEPETVYIERRHCYWARGPRYWDDYQGVWRRERVKVCD